MPASFTQLDCFLKCERQWWYRYRELIAEGESEPLTVGIVYHEALAKLARGQEVSDHDIAAWIEAESSKPYYPKSLDATKLVQEIQKNIRRVWAQIFPFLEIEKVETWLPRGGAYTGKIDIVSRTTPVVDCGQVVDKRPGRCVIDWKTINKISQWKKDHALQLGMYVGPEGADAGAIVEIPRDTVSAINVSVIEFDDHEKRRLDRHLRAQIDAMDHRTERDQCRLAQYGHPLCCKKYCAYWNICEGGKC